jgi:MFS family permease
MFVSIGFGALLWLVPWILLVRDNDRAIEDAVLRRPGIPAIGFGELLSNRVMWGIIIGSFCYNYFNYFCLTWLPAYFAESRGLSLNSTGWFTGFSFWGFAIVATACGFWADHIVRRGGDAVRVRKLFIIAGFLIASTEMIGAVSSSNRVALFFAIFSLSGLGLATGNYWAITPAILPGAPAARLAAVQNMAANLPGILAPILTGWLKQITGGYGAPMAANLGFLLLGIGSYIFLVRREYAPAAHHK